MNSNADKGLIEAAQKDSEFDAGKELKKMEEAIPPNLRPAFNQIISAGRQIVYGQETRDEILKFLTSDAPLEERLGNGVANLIVMIDNKANGKLPKEVFIPAATVLLFDVAETLTKGGEEIPTEVLAKSYEIMFYGIFAGYGMEPEKVNAAFDGMEQRMNQNPNQPANLETGGQ